jgi:hypothetical protein
MKTFDSYPRTLKKLLRFILQSTTVEELNEMERVLSSYIYRRKKELQGS